MTILPKIMNVRHNLPIYVALSIVLLVLCVSGLFYFSGHFARNPEIEVQADNNYEDTLHVVTDKDYKPYSFYDEEGNRSGYDVELITLIANRLHMNLDLDFVTWDEGLAIATGGGADVLMTCGLSDNFEGVENLIKTEITSMDEFAVYSKKPVSKLSSLHGKRIAIMANGNVVPEMEMLGLLPYCHFYTDNKSAMQALLDDEADFAVMRQAVGTMLLESMDLPGVSAYISAGRSYMCYCVNKNKPELADKINALRKEREMQARLEPENLTDIINTLSDIVQADMDNAFEEDRRTAIEAGMNEHIAKPIDVDNLRAVISRFVPGRAR